MDAGKSNKIYLIFLATVIPILIFFIAYPGIYKKLTFTSYSLDYNVIMSKNNYDFKMNNAIYITDTNEFVFTFHVAAKSGALASERPYISLVTAFDNKERANEYKDNYSFKKRSDTSEYVFVPGVISEFKYIKISATSTTPAYREEDSIDEFGDTVKGKEHEEVSKTSYCLVDKNEVLFITKAEADKILTTVQKEDDEEMIVTEEDRSSREYQDIELDSSPTVITTTTVTLPTTTDITSSMTDNSSNERSDSRSDPQNRDTVDGSDGGGGNGGYSYPQPETTIQTQPPRTEPPTTTTVTTTTQTAPKTTTTPRQTTTTSSVISPERIRIESDFSNNNVVLSVNDSTALRAIVEPSNAENKSVTWEVNKSGIIKIDENGKIIALSKGKVIVTASTIDGDLKASIMITVE